MVLENGEIVEEETHTELAIKNGKYYELVRNRLELNKPFLPDYNA